MIIDSQHAHSTSEASFDSGTGGSASPQRTLSATSGSWESTARRFGKPGIPASAARCLPFEADHDTVRVGFNYVRDLGEPGQLAMVAERERAGADSSFDHFLERLRSAPVGARAVRNLVMVGAFDAFGVPRRELLWGWQERWDGRGLRRRVTVQAELHLPGGAPRCPA